MNIPGFLAEHALARSQYLYRSSGARRAKPTRPGIHPALPVGHHGPPVYRGLHEFMWIQPGLPVDMRGRIAAETCAGAGQAAVAHTPRTRALLERAAQGWLTLVRRVVPWPVGESDS